MHPLTKIKNIVTVLLCIASSNCTAQDSSNVLHFDSSIISSINNDSGIFFITSGYPREKYTDTVLATIAYMVNDSSIRIIKTRVSQCEYYVSDNYNESHWIQRDFKFLDVDEDKIIKTISVKFPEHFNQPKPL